MTFCGVSPLACDNSEMEAEQTWNYKTQTHNLIEILTLLSWRWRWWRLPMRCVHTAVGRPDRRRTRLSRHGDGAVSAKISACDGGCPTSAQSRAMELISNRRRDGFSGGYIVKSILESTCARAKSEVKFVDA